MPDDTLRSVEIERVGLGSFRAINVKGASITVGGEGDLTAVELLLVAMAACSGADVDYITSKRAEPTRFRALASGDRIRDEHGNRLINLTLTFDVEFPEGPEGDQARAALPRAIEQSHNRLCTVSRTIETGTPIRSS